VGAGPPTPRQPIVRRGTANPFELHFNTIDRVGDGLVQLLGGRRPVAGVCRMRSSGIDVLQIADLLLGATVYEYKQAHGLVKYKPKLDLLAHIKKRTGVSTFVGGYTDTRINVAEYKS
jgi:hypothetical protein